MNILFVGIPLNSTNAFLIKLNFRNRNDIFKCNPYSANVNKLCEGQSHTIDIKTCFHRFLQFNIMIEME